MKIFHVSHSALPENADAGGAQRHQLEIIQGLSEEHSVIVFMPGAEKNLNHLNAEDVIFFHWGSGISGYVFCAINIVFSILKGIFKHGSPDLIYIREMPFFCYTAILSKLLQIPRVIEANGFLPESQPQLEEFKDYHYYPLIFAEAINYWLSNAIFPVSYTAQDKISDFYSIPQKKIFRIGNGADTSTFYPMNKTDCRNKTDIPTDEFVVTFMGTFTPWSGVRDLIKALPDLKNKIPKLRCLIISGYKDRDMIWNLSEHLDVENLIDIRGYISWNQLPLYLNTADVAVNPLKKENHSGDSLKTYEYLACGLPIICSKVNELESFITDDESGLLFEPGNSEDIARKILTLHSQEDHRKKLAKNARQSAKTKYDWSHRIKKINNIIYTL